MSSGEIITLIIGELTILTPASIGLYIFYKQLKQSDNQHEERMKQLEAQLKEAQSRYISQMNLIGHDCTCTHCLGGLKQTALKDYITTRTEASITSSGSFKK